MRLGVAGDQRRPAPFQFGAVSLIVGDVALQLRAVLVPPLIPEPGDAVVVVGRSQMIRGGAVVVSGALGDGGSIPLWTVGNQPMSASAAGKG